MLWYLLVMLVMHLPAVEPLSPFVAFVPVLSLLSTLETSRTVYPSWHVTFFSHPTNSKAWIIQIAGIISTTVLKAGPRVEQAAQLLPSSCWRAVQ